MKCRTPAERKLWARSGATSNLPNRLEAATHIVMTREQSNRRVVALRSTREIQETALSFFAPIAKQLEETAGAYSVAVLELVGEINGHLHAGMAAYLKAADDRVGRDYAALPTRPVPVATPTMTSRAVSGWILDAVAYRRCRWKPMFFKVFSRRPQSVRTPVTR